MLRKGLSPLVLTGLAVAGYYAYSKMSPDARKNLIEKAKQVAGDLPLDQLKNILMKMSRA